MVFILVPVEAQRIDVSEVGDIERERLRVVFKDGDELFFRVSMQYENGFSRLAMVLDPSLSEDGRVLQSEMVVRFYNERVYRSFGTIVRDALFRLPYTRPYANWTIEQVASKLEVRLEMGRPNGAGKVFASDLQVGALLTVEYGTQYSDPVSKMLVMKGVVTEIDTFLIPATAASRVAAG